MRLALLGDPVAHSRSPAIHTAALAAVEVEGTYRALLVDEDGFRAAVEDLRCGCLDGVNVTMPYKALAALTADEVDELVTATGAANTLRASRVSSGMVEATNTDVPGLISVAEASGIPADAPVLVLGGGGAAAAAVVAFAGRTVRCATRSGDGSTHAWGRGMPGAVVVNATPLGMNGEPLPPGVVESAAGLIDMAYGKRSTPAIETAIDMGIPRADGFDVLIAQAAWSFAWWTGLEPPLTAMSEAARTG